MDDTFLFQHVCVLMYLLYLLKLLDRFSATLWTWSIIAATAVTTYPSDSGMCVCVHFITYVNICIWYGSHHLSVWQRCACLWNVNIYIYNMGYLLYSKYLTWYFTRIVYIRPLTELLYWLLLLDLLSWLSKNCFTDCSYLTYTTLLLGEYCFSIQ